MREHWPAHWEKKVGSVEEEQIRIEEQWQQSNKLRELTKLIQGLPEAQRECVTLKYLENFTSPEIAQILKMKESTVRSHIHRGLTELRTQLKNQNHE